jgi:DNA invertase Pin-like site-specific DNA recombinase
MVMTISCIVNEKMNTWRNLCKELKNQFLKIMPKTIGYIRVSTDKQDLEKQKHILYDYAHKNKLIIDEFVEVEISSSKTQKERKIEELLTKLEQGDTLLVAELSRLGRNMLEVLGIVGKLNDKQIKIIFIRQPELSLVGSQTKLLLAIYSYIAETEKDFVSLRTKQALKALQEKGVKLGRPKGSSNKRGKKLDPYKDEIDKYHKMGVSTQAIMQIINSRLDKPIAYLSYMRFVKDLGTIKNP